jgi:hypothetical protein
MCFTAAGCTRSGNYTFLWCKYIFKSGITRYCRFSVTVFSEQIHSLPPHSLPLKKNSQVKIQKNSVRNCFRQTAQVCVKSASKRYRLFDVHSSLMLIHFFSYALAIYFFKYFSAVKILQEKPLIFITLSIQSGKQYPAICSILSSSFYKIIKSVSITRLQDIQYYIYPLQNTSYNTING